MKTELLKLLQDYKRHTEYEMKKFIKNPDKYKGTPPTMNLDGFLEWLESDDNK